MSSFTRRSFLGSATALAGATILPQAARAARPVERPQGPYMKLSLAAYSFNKTLLRQPSQADYDKAEMKLEDFVRYCADLNLDGTEITSYYFPDPVTNEYLMGLKQLAFKLGLDVSGTAIGNDFCVPEGPKRDEQLAMARQWIDYAADLGAPVIRIFAGKVPEGETEDVALGRCIEGINTSLDYAAEKGVFLALENHGGITATPAQLLRIVEGVKDSPWFGVNLDSGNFATEDPYADLEKIAPYAVNAQIKVMMRSPGGEKTPADFGRIIDILRGANYRGYVVLEYEESDAKGDIPGHIQKLRELIGR